MSTLAEPKNPDFRVAERWRFLYQALCRRGSVSQENEYWVFEKYTQLYSVAATIGFLLNKRNELKSTYTPFHLEQIESDPEWNSLRAIAWKASDCNTDVLLDNRSAIRICDEFSDAGMEHLYKEFFESHVKDNHLLRPRDIEIEENLALIIKGILRHRL